MNLSVDATQWTFVSFVLTNATSQTLYVNNLTPITDTVNRTPISLDVLNIGRLGGFWPTQGYPNYFTGQVDEVRIYNRALSGTEVTNLYNLGAEKLNVSPVSNLTSGLVGYWTFDGKDTPWSSSSAGTATDRSGNSNTGTLTNMSQSTSVIRGKLGQALTFDGTDDYVDAGTGTTLKPSFPFSISSWVKRSAGVYGSVVSTGDSSGNGDHSGYTLIISEDGYVLAQIGSNTATCGLSYRKLFTTNTATVTANVWHHIAVVFTDVNSFSIYVNGTLIPSTATGSAANMVYAAGSHFRIGKFYDGCVARDYQFSGSIDEVRIYNRALSATEITTLYNSGR